MTDNPDMNNSSLTEQERQTAKVKAQYHAKEAEGMATLAAVAEAAGKHTDAKVLRRESRRHAHLSLNLNRIAR